MTAMLQWLFFFFFFFLPESFVTITRTRIRRTNKIFPIESKVFFKFVSFFFSPLLISPIFVFTIFWYTSSKIEHTFSTIVGTNFEDFEDSIGEFCASELSLNGRKRVEVGTSGFDVISISQREFGISCCFIARPRGLLPTRSVSPHRHRPSTPRALEVALEFERAAGKCVKFRLGPVPA